MPGHPGDQPLRTLIDLAAPLGPDELEPVVAEAERRRLVRLPDLGAALDRVPGRHGAPTLRTLLRRQAAPALTRSWAERRLLALVRAAALPPPDQNVRVGGYELDFVWFDRRLVVETDGYGYHGGRAAFEGDRARDAALQAQGLRTMRFTGRQLAHRPHQVVARLSAALAQ